MKNNFYGYCSVYHLGRLSSYLGTGDLSVYLKELSEDRQPFIDLENAVKDVDFFRTKKWEGIFNLGLYRLLNYALVRELKPDYFLETGVLHGITSNFILSALSKNKKGFLVSIDYPSYFESGPSNKDGFKDTLPPGKEPGWVVPDKNRKYWKLMLGRSLDMIPKALESADMIDIFLHDSEHTYETMRGEFSLAWERIRAGGILISDNINTNTSFFDFCDKVNRTPILFPECGPNSANDVRFGLIKK